MNAVVIENDRLAWRERPEPRPGPTEILVAVRSAGVNGADLAQVRGAYPAPPGAPPDIPGLELAGEVVAAGELVTHFRAGDRVMGLVGGGAQAELAIVDETHALAVPDTVDWPEAGGFPEAFFTAFDALFAHADLGAGERILVTGAAGGVGVAAVQLAAVVGARIVASVRVPALRGAVALFGADVVDPVVAPDHGPYDVIVELVGAGSLAAVLPALATAGRVIVIGLGDGATLRLDLSELMRRRARIAGSTLRARTAAEKAALTAAIERRALPLLAADRIRVPVHEQVPMSEAARGYEHFRAGGKLGKIVLVV